MTQRASTLELTTGKAVSPSLAGNSCDSALSGQASRGWRPLSRSCGEPQDVARDGLPRWRLRTTAGTRLRDPVVSQGIAESLHHGAGGERTTDGTARS